MKFFIISVISLLFRLASYVLWAYVILSWIARSNPTLWRIYCTLSRYIEPLLAPFQKMLGSVAYRTGIDFSPILLALVFSMVYKIIVRLLLLI